MSSSVSTMSTNDGGGGPPTTTRQQRQQEIRSLEHPTLKLPYEMLNRKYKLGQKCLERDTHGLLNVLEEVNATAINKEEMGSEADDEENEKREMIEAAIFRLEAIAEKLRTLKKRTHNIVQGEQALVENCVVRVQHLRSGIEAESDLAWNQWRRVRMHRLLVDYLLRSGYYKSALQLSLATETHELSNVQLLSTAQEVEASLQSKSTGKLLSFCQENRSKMRKLNSGLEFSVRVQEFCELARQGKRLEAVKYARKHLTSSDQSEHLGSVQRLMGALAFPIHSQSGVHSSYSGSPYSSLLSVNQWSSLVSLFRNENYRLMQMSSTSVFTAALQAGLSSLKTPQCYREAQKRDRQGCPVCQPNLNALASQLPFAHCSQSKLICAMSSMPLNEHNVPLMLPNGFVYGQKALEALAKNNQGQVVCPRTKEIFRLTDALKVYVM